MNVAQILENAVKGGFINKGKLTDTRDFILSADKRFEQNLQKEFPRLKQKLQADGHIHPKSISGTCTTEHFMGQEHRRPLIDLVQQGGGMYGIALLGYTYVMEKVGIRFYSHGGTSAGAINATFLASISNSIYTKKSLFFEDTDRQAFKSELLAHIIINTDFKLFMEREGIVGKMQRWLFRTYGSYSLGRMLKRFVAFTLGILALVYGSFGLVYRIKNGLTGFELRTYDFFIGTLNVLAVLLLYYVFLIRVLGNRFGLNKGKVFYDWCTGLLGLLQIHRTDELWQRMGETKFEGKNEGEEPRLVLISSNLTHNRIVKFPERAADYWQNHANVKPAAYLRATMSLPFIFEVFIPDSDHYHKSEPENHIKQKARFVDGGMLSNFPIREFHRTDGVPPRFPTFGVLLSKLQEDKRTRGPLRETGLLGFITSFLKTFRYFYDKDFINSSKEIKDRVVTVDTTEFNWLDFWMELDDKKKLFLKGVDAAMEQLDKFEWHDYFEIRTTAEQTEKMTKK